MPKSARPNVYQLSRPSRCHNCDLKLPVGEIVKLHTKDDEEREALCLECAGLSDFVVVPAGNAAVTRLASKYSDPAYTIMKWSELWKTYERQGIMVKPDALERAKKEAGL